MTRYARRNFTKEKDRKFKSRNQWEEINTAFVLPTKPQWIKAGELIFSSSLRPPQCRHLFLNWWDVSCTPTIKSITPTMYLTHSWAEVADLNDFQVSVKGEICTSAKWRPETRHYYLSKNSFFFFWYSSIRSAQGVSSVIYFWLHAAWWLFQQGFKPKKSMHLVSSRWHQSAVSPRSWNGRRLLHASAWSIICPQWPDRTAILHRMLICARQFLFSLFFFFLIVAKLLWCCCEQQLRDFWNELPDAHACAAQPLEVWNWPQVTPIPFRSLTY